MKLVMFDMDGTLTDSFAMDENCYVRAIEQTLSLTNIVIEWDAFTHASASYCLEEIVRRARGHAPTAAESSAVQASMVALMSEIARERGRCTREISGAAACIAALPRLGYAVAIASGDWEATARHKLTSAGIPFEGLPAAFCEAGHARTEIMQTALQRAAQHYKCERFERIVYVGDAAWDVRACRELGWPLIAVGEDTHALRLASVGATQVISGYTPIEEFLVALEHASVPCSPPSAARAS